MKKSALPIIAVSMLLASCGGAVSTLSREEESWPIPTPTSSSTPSQESSVPATKTSEKDVEQSDKEQISKAPIEEVSSEISQEAPKEATVADLNSDLSNFISLYMTKLASFKNYKSVTKGSTKATVLFIETTQTIDVTSIKGEYCYLKNESHGAVDSVHEAYFHDGNALVKNLNEEQFSKVAMNDYLNSYGVNPYGYNIEGYSINGDAITSISKSATETNAFEIVFDNEKATNNVRIQMKAFGSLDDYPVFSSIKVTIHVQENLTPIKYVVEASYNAKRFGIDTACQQKYEVTFSDFDANPEIPNLSEIRAKYAF